MSVTVVLGVKGGVGTTTSSLRLAGEGRGGAAVVDLDLVHGDLAWRLGVTPLATIADLASLEDGDVDAEHIRALSYETRVGVLVPSPASAELAELVTPEHVRAVLAALGTGRVVVDAGSHIDTRVLAACHEADDVVLVARSGSWHAGQVRAVADLLRRAAVTAPLRVHVPSPWPGASRRLAGAVGLDAYVGDRRWLPLGRAGRRPGIVAPRSREGLT